MTHRLANTNRRFLTLVTALLTASLAASDTADACRPKAPPVVACVKSVAIVKGVPAVFIIPPAGITIFLPATVITSTGPSPTIPDSICPEPATVTGGLVTMTLIAPPFITPLAVGMAPVAPAPAGFSTQVVLVPLFIPAGTFGLFFVTASAAVTFSADSSLLVSTVTGTGDTVICFVPEVGGAPPRLDLKLRADDLSPLDPPFVHCQAGQPVEVVYEITNNDPTNTVSLTLTASSDQRADEDALVTPIDDTTGAYSISDNLDDFRIQFDTSVGLDTENPSPTGQAPITKSITLQPGEVRLISLFTTSFSACADGSCSEEILVAEGTFANGDPVTACAGFGAIVDNSAPPHAPCCLGNATKESSGGVNFSDITAVLGNWLALGDGTGPGDANCDGVVNFADITAVLGNWLNACP